MRSNTPRTQNSTLLVQANVILLVIALVVLDFVLVPHEPHASTVVQKLYLLFERELSFRHNLLYFERDVLGE